MIQEQNKPFLGLEGVKTEGVKDNGIKWDSVNLKAVMQEMVSEQTFKRWPVESQKRGLFLLLKAMQNAHVSRERTADRRKDSQGAYA